jgi:hypothetical protein
MRFRCFIAFAFVVALLAQTGFSDQGPAKKTEKEALQQFNDLIGAWRGTATPAGTKQEQQDGFWVETITWSWQFKDKDVCLSVAFDKSKQFTRGTLRYVPEKDHFVMKVTNIAKEERTYTGKLSDSILTLDSDPDAKGDVHRVVITLLHDNRHLYRLDKKKADRASFANVFKVGATREGVDFASGSGKPECIVTGGLGTQQVSFQGKTYYVCCGGCADEFRANAAKYVKEYEEKKGKKK